MAQQPQATPNEEQVILIRGSEEHQNYLKHQFGRIKGWVHGFETRIAVAGRAFLLIYVAYITIKAGAGIIHVDLPPQAASAVTVALFLLDIFMLTLQVLGLEGSVSGLVHLADDMERQGKNEEARSIRAAADTAQFLMGATAVDVVLQYMPHQFAVPGWGMLDITWIAFAFDKILFIVRVIVIGRYLKAMARLERKGPKIISQTEYDRQQHEVEQEQVRMDNTAIQHSISQALTLWTHSKAQQYQARNEEVLARWMEEQRLIIVRQLEEVRQAPLQAIIAELAPQFQARFQALDEAILRQNVAIDELQNQARRVPERRPASGKRVPEHRQQIQVGHPTTKHTQHKVANASRDELKAEAIRLRTVEGLSSYKIAELLGKPAKTVQSWLSASKDQAESKAAD